MVCNYSFRNEFIIIVLILYFFPNNPVGKKSAQFPIGPLSTGFVKSVAPTARSFTLPFGYPKRHEAKNSLLSAADEETVVSSGTIRSTYTAIDTDYDEYAILYHCLEVGPYSLNSAVILSRGKDLDEPRFEEVRSAKLR